MTLSKLLHFCSPGHSRLKACECQQPNRAKQSNVNITFYKYKPVWVNILSFSKTISQAAIKGGTCVACGAEYCSQPLFLSFFWGEHLLWLIGALTVTSLCNENSLLYIVSEAHCVKLNREAIKWNWRHWPKHAKPGRYLSSMFSPFKALKLQTDSPSTIESGFTVCFLFA